MDVRDAPGLYIVCRAQYTPPTPTRRNCFVASRRRCIHEFATTADGFGDANAQRSRRPWPSLQYCSQRVTTADGCVRTADATRLDRDVGVGGIGLRVASSLEITVMICCRPLKYNIRRPAVFVTASIAQRITTDVAYRHPTNVLSKMAFFVRLSSPILHKMLIFLRFRSFFAQNEFLAFLQMYTYVWINRHEFSHTDESWPRVFRVFLKWYALY